VTCDGWVPFERRFNGYVLSVELIADAYEKALKKEPKNEELHSHLFMAYVRLSDYKKQQLAAINLYRLKPKNPYYFWAVMSVLMQVIISCFAVNWESNEGLTCD
jgi:hypothetical protein